MKPMETAAPAALREGLRALLERNFTQRIILWLILINAVVLGLETVPSVMSAYGGYLIALDKAILAVFVVEIAARVYVHRLAFFRDPWSVFDFVVVGIALVPASGQLAVLRALRVLRVLRILTIVPSMRRVVGALLSAIPGLGSIALVLLLLYYVFAVIATNFPLHALPDHDAGELVDGHRATGDGELPLRLGLLRALHPGRDLHDAEPLRRYHRQRDADLRADAGSKRIEGSESSKSGVLAEAAPR